MMLRRGAERETQSVPSLVRGWELWTIPASARAYLLLVQVIAVTLTVLAVRSEPPSGAVLLRFGVLVVLSLGYAEATRRVERIRRYLAADTDVPVPNSLSVWSFAALLTLPVGWAACFVVVQQAHEFLEHWQEKTAKPHRELFNAGAAILAQLAAGAVLWQAAPGDLLSTDLSSAASVVATGIFYMGFNLVLVLTAIRLAARPPSLRAILPDGDALGYEC